MVKINANNNIPIDIKNQINQTIRFSWFVEFMNCIKQEGVQSKEGLVLYSLANLVSKTLNKPIVEIGSYKGRSTIYLAKGVKHSAQKNIVFAVDPFDGGDSPEYQNLKDNKKTTWDIFKQNIAKAKVGKFVRPIKKKSQDAIKGFNHKISLLFIDGSHEYANVKQDFLLWSPLLIKNGILAFHDYSPFFKDVQKVVDKYVEEDSFKLLDIWGSLLVFIKI